jgi:hypothetical protein
MWLIRAKVHGFTRLQNEMIQEVNTETTHISWVNQVQLQECGIVVRQRTLI